MFDFPCSMTQRKNALIICTSITLFNVIVVSSCKLINSHTCVSSPKASLFLSIESCILFVCLFFKAQGQNLKTYVLFGKASQTSVNFPLHTNIGIHLLVSFVFLNLHVLFMVTIGFSHLKL